MADLLALKYDVGIDYVSWPDVALKIESGDTVFCSDKLDAILGNQIKTRFIDWIG